MLCAASGSAGSAAADSLVRECDIARSSVQSVTGAWLRRVVEVAGHEIASCTANAWIGVTPLTHFTIWATEPWRRPSGMMRATDSALRGAYTDGTRVVWEAQGLAIWVGPGPGTGDVLPGKTAFGWLQSASKGLPRRYGPIAFMPTPAASLRTCRSDARLAPACPLRIPRLLFSGWHTSPSPPRPVNGIFDMQRGGEIPGKPELMRPPGNLHIEVEVAVGAAKPRGIGFRWPTSGAARPRDGMVHEERSRPVLFGRVNWGGRPGTVALAPAYPNGGSQGNHVVFRWQDGRSTYLVGMHAWEPFTEAYTTLRRVVASLPR